MLVTDELAAVANQYSSYQWFLQKDLISLSHNTSLQFEWRQEVWLGQVILLYLSQKTRNKNNQLLGN